MLFQKETSQASAVIKAYKPGLITLNIGEYDQAVLLVDGELKDYQGPQDYQQVSAEILLEHVTEQPEIMIIGTGEKHQILSPKITQTINKQGIAVESMASREACHTYQVLSFEQRRICALIFP